jgi:hypothetical protein
MFKRKGEAYIDTIITIFLSIVVIYIACSVFSVIYTHQRITDFADKFSEYVSLHGCTSSKQVEDLYEKMIEEYELNPDAIYLSFDGSDYIEDNKNVIGAVQYGGKMVVSLRYVKNVGFLNDVGFIPIPVSVRKVVLSQNYWKDGTYEDNYSNTQIKYLVVRDFKNITAEEPVYTVLAGEGISLSLRCDETCIMPDSISVFAGERELIANVDYVYDRISDTFAMFVVPSVNSNIVINAEAVVGSYRVTYSIPAGMETSLIGSLVNANQPCYIVFYPATGTVINEFSVSMGGNDITSTSWNSLTNTLYIENVVGDINITASVIPATTIKISVPTAGFIMKLAFENVGATSTTIYWGDGATTQVSGTGKQTVNHIYGLAGEYTINAVFNGTWNPVSYGTNDTMFSDAKERVKLVYLDDLCGNIDDYAFNGCSELSKLRLPTGENFKHIGNYAFTGCTRLETVIIDAPIITIGSDALRGCTLLNEIYITNGEVMFISGGAFMELKPGSKIYIRPGYIQSEIQGSYSATTTVICNTTWVIPAQQY